MAISDISEIEIGQAIPSIEHVVDKMMMVKYCGASEDYSTVHWDQDWVREQGFPTVVTQGWLTFALMCQSVTNWIPREIADIAKYAVRCRKPSVPGKMFYGGTVVGKRDGDNEKAVDLELWAKDDQGLVTTTATMTVVIH